MTNTNVLEHLILALPEMAELHSPDSASYRFLRTIARQEIASRFAQNPGGPRDFAPFGEVHFPYEKMGVIDSLDLFGLDELILFSFYWANRKRYRRTLDLGANLGLHSLIMARCGYEVIALEPDPRHFELLQRNLVLNGAAGEVTALQSAISTQSGSTEFIRVLGNTTGSHLAGAKPNVYGEIDRFTVDLLPFSDFCGKVDFVKMDVEGHEASILCSTAIEQWEGLDMMAEIGSEANACAVFTHLSGIGVNLFSQKIGWKTVP